METTKLVELFEFIALNSIKINKFVYCRLEDFNAEKDKQYPMLFLEEDFIWGYTLAGGQSYRTITFGYFLLSTFSEQFDVNRQYLTELSTLEQLGQSIIQYLYKNIPSYFFQVQDEIKALNYLGIFGDDTIALKYDLTIKLPFSIDSCDAYFEEPFNSTMYEPC